MDFKNLLPIVGDRTLKTFGSKMIVGPNGNMKGTWNGATTKTEDSTKPDLNPFSPDNFKVD